MKAPTCLYKYSLPQWGRAELALPAGTKLLHVAFQGADLQLWAAVPTGPRPYTKCVLHVYQTGNPLDDAPREYIGTALNPEGSYVVHVFELLK